VPLRTGVENPQHCLKHAPRRHRFAFGRRQYALPENVSGFVPIARRRAESFDIYSGSRPVSNFEIGSSQKQTHAYYN
jgi:hypothetical protein